VFAGLNLAPAKGSFMGNKKQLVCTLKARDFQWSYYKASGKSGQKRNKTMNGVRWHERVYNQRAG
jgi:protein subunit release factor B